MNQEDSAKFILDLRNLEVVPVDFGVHWQELSGDFIEFSSLEEAVAFAEGELERLIEQVVRDLRCQLMQNLTISCERIRRREQEQEDD